MKKEQNPSFDLPFEIKDNIRHVDFRKSCLYLQELGRKLFGPKFRIHDSDRELIYKLLVYAIRDEENCVKHDIDLNKGILLLGPVGCGKTSLMTLLNVFIFPNFRYQVKNTRQIATEFNKEGFEIIHRYGRREKILCLDDLGVEQSMKHYGNECNTIGEILLHRYDMHVNYEIITHATTNLNAEELEKLYGNRVRSRLRSMFNLISFPMEAKDKRK